MCCVWSAPTRLQNCRALALRSPLQAASLGTPPVPRGGHRQACAAAWPQAGRLHACGPLYARALRGRTAPGTRAVASRCWWGLVALVADLPLAVAALAEAVTRGLRAVRSGMLGQAPGGGGRACCGRLCWRGTGSCGSCRWRRSGAAAGEWSVCGGAAALLTRGPAKARAAGVLPVAHCASVRARGRESGGSWRRVHRGSTNVAEAPSVPRRCGVGYGSRGGVSPKVRLHHWPVCHCHTTGQLIRRQGQAGQHRHSRRGVVSREAAAQPLATPSGCSCVQQGRDSCGRSRSAVCRQGPERPRGCYLSAAQATGPLPQPRAQTRAAGPNGDVTSVSGACAGGTSGASGTRAAVETAAASRHPCWIHPSPWRRRQVAPWHQMRHAGQGCEHACPVPVSRCVLHAASETERRRRQQARVHTRRGGFAWQGSAGCAAGPRRRTRRPSRPRRPSRRATAAAARQGRVHVEWRCVPRGPGQQRGGPWRGREGQTRRTA